MSCSMSRRTVNGKSSSGHQAMWGRMALTRKEKETGGHRLVHLTSHPASGLQKIRVRNRECHMYVWIGTCTGAETDLTIIPLWISAHLRTNIAMASIWFHIRSATGMECFWILTRKGSTKKDPPFSFTAKGIILIREAALQSAGQEWLRSWEMLPQGQKSASTGNRLRWK